MDNYKTVTKEFELMHIQYHTYQFPEDKQLSIIINNLPVLISDETIFFALRDLEFE